jgi:hypothetical protein
MSLYDAYVVADSALGWKAEVSARVGDFLARNRALGQEVLRFVERAVEGSLRLADLRESLVALKGLVHRRRESQAPPVPPELEALVEREALFERIAQHGKKGTIEDYSSYLFAVDSGF